MFLDHSFTHFLCVLLGEEHNFQKLTAAEIDSRNEEYDYGYVFWKNIFALRARLTFLRIR